MEGSGSIGSQVSESPIISVLSCWRSSCRSAGLLQRGVIEVAKQVLRWAKESEQGPAINSMSPHKKMGENKKVM